MSALAKLYASRGMTYGDTEAPERSNASPPVLLNPELPPVLRRKIEAEKQTVPKEVKQRKVSTETIDYTSALNMLENVNAGFVDVFDRLQKTEAIKDQLVAECEKQDIAIRQYQLDLEALQRRYEESERQNSEIAERLISESSRASNSDHRASEAEHALAEAYQQIEHLNDVCKTLHDGIYAVFGSGSPTQKVLSALEES